LVSFNGDSFGILGIAKALKLLLVMELSEPYTEAVFDLVMVFTIWANILAIFGHEAKASAYITHYNFYRLITGALQLRFMTVIHFVQRM
jgi:hypothetical protein